MSFFSGNKKIVTALREASVSRHNGRNSFVIGGDILIRDIHNFDPMMTRDAGLSVSCTSHRFRKCSHEEYRIRDALVTNLDFDVSEWGCVPLTDMQTPPPSQKWPKLYARRRVC